MSHLDSFPIVVVLPAPLTPTTRKTYGSFPLERFSSRLAVASWVSITRARISFSSVSVAAPSSLACFLTSATIFSEADSPKSACSKISSRLSRSLESNFAVANRDRMPLFELRGGKVAGVRFSSEPGRSES